MPEYVGVVMKMGIKWQLHLCRRGVAQRHNVSLHFGLLRTKNSWLGSRRQAVHIGTQQLSPACYVLEHMGTLHPDGQRLDIGIGLFQGAFVWFYSAT